MADIDADELERAVAFLERDATLLAAETLPAYVALGPVLAAARAYLAALRTAAKEAQLRVLDRALNIASRADSQSDARDLLTTLRARVERGEDV